MKSLEIPSESPRISHSNPMKSLKITSEFHSNPLKSPEDPIEFPNLIPSISIKKAPWLPQIAPCPARPHSGRRCHRRRSTPAVLSRSGLTAAEGWLRSVLELDPLDLLDPPKKHVDPTATREFTWFQPRKTGELKRFLEQLGQQT